MDGVGARHVSPTCCEPAGCSQSKHDSQNAAAEADEQAFRQLLTAESQATAAERGANRDLFAAGRGARYEQIGNIEARDEEQAADCAKQNIEGRLDVTGHILQHWARIYPIRNRTLRAQALMNLVLKSACFLGRAFCAHSWLQTRDNVRHVVEVALQIFRVVVDMKRGPQLNQRIRIAERLWKHSYDGKGPIVEPNILSEDGRIAIEATFEEVPGNDDCFRSGCGVIVRRKRSPPRGLHAKSREDVPRSGYGVQSFRQLFLVTGNAVAGPTPDCHLFKAVRLSLPVVEITRRYDVVFVFSLMPIEHH